MGGTGECCGDGGRADAGAAEDSVGDEGLVTGGGPGGAEKNAAHRADGDPAADDGGAGLVVPQDAQNGGPAEGEDDLVLA